MIAAAAREAIAKARAALIVRRPRPALERFEEKWTPEPNTGCWLWLGATLTKHRSVPYGSFRLKADENPWLSHSFSDGCEPLGPSSVHALLAFTRPLHLEVGR